MEITKREIISSISIISILLLIGILITGRITESNMDKNEKYNKAIKIESTELFQYGMNTSVGYAFIHGDLIALNAVTYPEIGSKYLYISKTKERYTMHTRTVTTTVNGKTRTRTETYWTWDKVGFEDIKSKKIKFCGIEFNSSQINIPGGDYIDTIKESSHIRYVYYGYPAESKGTIFTYLKDGNIEKDGISFHKDMTISETIDYLESGFGLIIFWILWIVLIIGLVCGFYYLDNRWLYK